MKGTKAGGYPRAFTASGVDSVNKLRSSQFVRARISYKV